MFHSYTHLKKTSEQLHSFGCFVLRIIRSHLCTRLQKKNPKIIKTNFYCLILHNAGKNTMQSMKYNLEYNVHNLISQIYQEFSQSTLNTVELQECFDAEPTASWNDEIYANTLVESIFKALVFKALVFVFSQASLRKLQRSNLGIHRRPRRWPLAWSWQCQNVFCILCTRIYLYLKNKY
jgi:hypothetical protein